MRPELSAVEARIVGCLIEKEITTPDQYPLTLNALTHAANQKSNRDPVMSLSESEVRSALEGLMRRHLITDRSGGAGGRVTRYRQRFCNTQFSQLSLSPPETAIVCELLLRGAQTPGELRSRSDRLHGFSEVGEVEEVLRRLGAGDDALVVELPREPGQRENRWRHTMGKGTDSEVSGASSSPSAASTERAAAAAPRSTSRVEQPTATPEATDLAARVATLESRLQRIERRVEGLLAELGSREEGD
jgi:uncharacterized protein YceH (UPF0502 family)